MLGLAFVVVGSFYRQCLLVRIFILAFQALSSPAPMSFLHAGTSSEVTHTAASPSSLSLPSEGRDERGRSRDALVLLPEDLLSSRSSFGEREGWRSLWSLVWGTRARFCLLGSFVEWGSKSCSLAADSCYPICPGGFSLLISARPAR